MSELKFMSGLWVVIIELESEYYCLIVECGNVMRVNVIISVIDIIFVEGLE